VAYTRHPGNGLLQSASVGSLAETCDVPPAFSSGAVWNPALL
jgi:hypothetical protein